MYTTIKDDLKSLNTAMCVLHPKYQDALKRIQKLVEEKLKSPKSKLNEQSTPLCECGRPLVNKLVCSDRNCQQTSW